MSAQENISGEERSVRPESVEASASPTRSAPCVRTCTCAWGGLCARARSIDIAQSVVREALADKDRFEGGDESLRAWLWRRAENKIRDRGRFWARQRRDAKKEVGQVDDPALFEAYGSLLTPSRIAMGREEIARVERAFAELADDQRRVILLARVANLSHAEVARAMGRSELATRSLLSRSIARLSMLLEER